MKKGYSLKVSIFCILCIGIILGMTGCGKEKINIIIQDGLTCTCIETKPWQTVEDLLNEAEIILNPGDTISITPETMVGMDKTEIKISRHAKVVVKTEDEETEVELIGKTVKDALEKANVSLESNDYVNHDLNAYLKDGMQISVVHRMAVTLTLDGETKNCLTKTYSVAGFLKDQGVKLGELDRVTPSRLSKLSDGAKIVVKRVHVEEVTETEPVLFETEVQYSNSMSVGTSKIVKAGINGEKRVTYLITYVDGKEESREVINEVILKKAENQIVMKGSKPEGKTVVSRERVDDCDGSGHGYYIVTYADGTVEYIDY